MQFSPLNRIKAIAPTPGGEEMAQMISWVEFVIILIECEGKIYERKMCFFVRKTLFGPVVKEKMRLTTQKEPQTDDVLLLGLEM